MAIALAAGVVGPAAAARIVLIPASGNSAYVQARTADAIGDQARAALLFAAMARAEPANGDLARRAIGAAIDAGDGALALSVARTLPTAAVTLDARLLLIGDALRRGAIDEAAGLVAKGNSDSEGGFLAPLLRAWSERAAGRDGQTLLANIAADSPLAPFAAEQRAAMLLRARRIDEALALIPQALDNAGGRATRLRLGFAAMLAGAGRRDEARKLLAGGNDAALNRLDLDRPQAGIAIDTPSLGYSELLTGLAVGLASGDDRQLPLSLIQIARMAAPTNSEASLVAALLLDRQSRRRDALAILATIPANDPFAPDALDARTRLLLAETRGAEALAGANAAATARGALATDVARLGNVYDELDRHADAAAAYGRAIALAEREGRPDRWSYRLLRAGQLDKLDRWPEARAELQAGLKLAPDEPLLLNYLGYGSLERGEDVAAAESMIRRALALRPGDAAITDSLGWALFKSGRTPEAIEALRTAAAAEPADVEINEHLGDALYQSGRRFEARFSWRAALISAEGEARTRIAAKIDNGLSKVTGAP